MAAVNGLLNHTPVTMTTSLTLDGCSETRGTPSDNVVPQVWEELGAGGETLAPTHLTT